MCHQPGFRLVKPRTGFERIAEWANEQGLTVKELQPSFSKDNKFFGSSGEWKVLKQGELGVHLKTELCNLNKWPDEWKNSLEKFVKKLQENSEGVYYFHDFADSHLKALAKHNKIPWEPLPEKGVIKFMVDHRDLDP